MSDTPAADQELHVKKQYDDLAFIPKGAITLEDYKRLMVGRNRNLTDPPIQRRRKSQSGAGLGDMQ